MRPSRKFCAAQKAFHYCLCITQWQPVFICIISDLTFSMQWSLLPGWKTLSIPLNFRTPTARRVPPSINLLVGPGTLLLSMPRFSTYHRFTTPEERAHKKDHEPRQKVGVRPREGRNTEGKYYHWPLLVIAMPEKSPDLDSIFAELILHAGSAHKFWLCDFFTFCMPKIKISTIWRRAPVVAILKPNKILGDQRSYRPIYT